MYSYAFSTSRLTPMRVYDRRQKGSTPINEAFPRNLTYYIYLGVGTWFRLEMPLCFPNPINLKAY